MGEDIKVESVVAENGGTLIQVDISSNSINGRLFINTRDIFKALNNYLYEANDKEMLKIGFELKDPKNYKNPNLIN